MADIESQVQGAGKNSTIAQRPSYTRLCTVKILPICLAICVISVFSAAIVCTSLNKPVPSNAVIMFSIIAACLLLLIFFGYLKIYHDRNGMNKVHPRAEQALKVCRDRLVNLFCCIEMDAYETSSSTKAEPIEAVRPAPKESAGPRENVGESTSRIPVLEKRTPQKREPPRRKTFDIRGPRDQPRVLGQGLPRRSNPYSNGEGHRQSQRQPPTERQQPLQTHRPPTPSPQLDAAVSASGSGPPTMGESHVPLSETADSIPFYRERLSGQGSRGSLRSQRRHHEPSALVAPLNTSNSIRGQYNRAAYMVSVPDIVHWLPDILRHDPITIVPKSFAKPARVSICDEEGIGSYCRSSTSSPISPAPSTNQTASFATTNVSSTFTNSPTSSCSSAPTTPTEEKEEFDFPQFPAQCRAEQRILRNTRDIMAKHRLEYHAKYPTVLEYCRSIKSNRQTASESTSQSGDL